MKISKNMKAGYQGKHDSMRAMAEKLLDHPGHAKDVYYSKSCADKERMRPYKEGGHAKVHKSHEMKEMEHHKVHKKHEMKEKEHERHEMKEKKHHRDHEKMEHLKKGGEVKKKCEHSKKLAEGGSTKEYKKGGKVQKFAEGGVGKIRLGVATADGKLKAQKMGSTRGGVYY